MSGENRIAQWNPYFTSLQDALLFAGKFYILAGPRALNLS